MKPFPLIGPVGLVCVLLIPGLGVNAGKGQESGLETKTNLARDGWKEFRVLHPDSLSNLLSFVRDGKTLVTAGTKSGFVPVFPFETSPRMSGKTQKEDFLGKLFRGSETLWDLTKVDGKVTLDAGFGGRFFFAISPDGKTLATEDKVVGIALWDLMLGKQLTKIGGLSSTVRSLAFSPDGKTLVSGHFDALVRFWDIPADKKKMVLRSSLDTRKDGVTCLAFSPDGQTLATGSYDTTITLWDVVANKALTTLLGHRERLIALTYSPDGKTLASISGDGGVKLWDLSKAKEKATFQGIPEVTALAFSPDGKILAFCIWENPNDQESRAVVMLCDSVSGKKSAVLKSKMDPPKTLAFSRDGRMLALSGFDSIRYSLNQSLVYSLNQSLVTVWKRE
jgi:WD40 repeat protein